MPPPEQRTALSTAMATVTEKANTRPPSRDRSRLGAGGLLIAANRRPSLRQLRRIIARNGNCYLCHNCGNSMGCSVKGKAEGGSVQSLDSDEIIGLIPHIANMADVFQRFHHMKP